MNESDLTRKFVIVPELAPTDKVKTEENGNKLYLKDRD